ncbi:hypothetical protein [Salibacterium lacus]|uniref:Uncharacterized protein n=1 Tax=Salibacterium lacus TaxID=1898109 RepID=A0ABW5T6H3_9BACI
MSEPIELRNHKEIFDEIFSETVIAVQTKHESVTYYVTVYCEVKLIEKEIRAEAVRMYGEIDRTLNSSFFGGIIDPQTVDYPLSIKLLKLDAIELFEDEDWPRAFRSMLEEAVQTNITQATYKTSTGKEKSYDINAKSVIMLD